MPVKTKGFSRLSKRVDGLEGATRDAMRDVLGDALHAGEIAMADRVQTGGTGKTWAKGWEKSTLQNAFYGRGASIPGRVATGNMRDMVTSSVDKDSKHMVRGRFGWLRGTEAYFLYQDDGFTHSITNDKIEGMEARRAGQEAADIVWLEGAERVAKALADWKF